MRLRTILSVVIAGILLVITSVSAFAQWPTTCVELNDIVEAHLGNDGNVGIYQRAYGLAAEEACQADHGDDVRSVFAWAALTIVQAPVSDISRETNWRYGADYDPLTSDYRIVAYVEDEGGNKIQAQCNVTQAVPGLYVRFGGYTYLSTVSYRSNEVNVEWRIDDGVPVKTRWVTDDGNDTLWIPPNQMDEMAQRFTQATRFVVRADGSTVAFSFSGAHSPNHPVAYVLRSCGRNV